MIAGFPLLALLASIFLFFFNVTVSSNLSCFYCYPKTLGITKTEIQSVFFFGLWGSGTWVCLSFLAVIGVEPNLQETLKVLRIVRLVVGISC